VSLFAEISNAEHTFASWAEKEWTAICNAAPKLEQVADTTLKYVAGALQIASTIEADNPQIAKISNALSTAQNGITAASGLIADFGATPTASGILTSVSSNLSALLSAAHITNPKSVAAVTKAINETNVLAAAISAAPTA
jgi:hypothetical protein